MKKNLLMLGCITTMLFGIGTVNALTLNEDGTRTNNLDYTMTIDEYQKLKDDGWSDADIDKLSWDAIQGIAAGNYHFKSEIKNIVTTITYNRLGEIVDVKQLEVSDEEGERILENDNIHILDDGNLHDLSQEEILMPYATEWFFHETTYKTLQLDYDYDNGEYSVNLVNTWKKTPNIKSYDVIAVRFGGTKNTTSYRIEAHQYGISADNYQYYDDSSENLNKFTNGVGLTQNLFDGSSYFINQLTVFSSYTFGYTVYGSYQHCQSSSITKAQSKSYHIDSTGLGDVIKFDGTIGNSYDGMAGVYNSFS